MSTHEAPRNSNDPLSIRHQIDVICDAFEKELKSGVVPSFGPLLEQVPQSNRAELLRQLLQLIRDYSRHGMIPPSVEGLRQEISGYDRVFDDVFNEEITGQRTGDSDRSVCPSSSVYEQTVVTSGSRPDDGETTEDHNSRRDRGSDKDVKPSHLTNPNSRIRYFGDYELVNEIARGGMGVVYRAVQTSLNRPVALKMILSGELAGDQEIARFHREAEAAANLDHAHIVPIYEIGQHCDQHYFSMGLIEGQSLNDRIRSGPLEPRDACRLLVAVTHAIDYAHSKGVIHRDLKPGNILLDSQNQPHVTDFGLAKQLHGNTELTATGQILGTPAYMPPEQARGDLGQIGPASDIYSLGALLYVMLTGRPPFQAASAMETLMQVMNNDPVRPKLMNSEIPVDLETIALKCLQRDPTARYASAGALADELERFLNGEPIHARPVSDFEKLVKFARRKPQFTGLACSFVILVSLLLFPLSTLDDKVWQAYGTAFRNSLPWFGIASMIGAIYIVRQIIIYLFYFAGRKVVHRLQNHQSDNSVLPGTMSLHKGMSYESLADAISRQDKQSREELIWRTILVFTIAAPGTCFLMLIIQVIRYMRGESL